MCEANLLEIGVEDVSVIEPYIHAIPLIIAETIKIAQAAKENVPLEKAGEILTSGLDREGLKKYGNTLISDFFN